MPLRILALGDIVGRPGRQIVHQKLPTLVRERHVDLVIANGENIAGGSGITQNLFHKLRSYGVDVVTLGDHIYKKADIIPTLQSSERIVRPANLSPHAAGRPFTVVTTNSGVRVAVFSLLGRRKDRVMHYMTTNMPLPFDIATHDVRLCGIIAEVDPETGRALSIERLEATGGNAEQAYDADDKAPPVNLRES